MGRKLKKSLHNWIVELYKRLKAMHPSDSREYRNHLEYIAGILLTRVDELDEELEEQEWLRTRAEAADVFREGLARNDGR